MALSNSDIEKIVRDLVSPEKANELAKLVEQYGNLSSATQDLGQHIIDANKSIKDAKDDVERYEKALKFLTDNGVDPADKKLVALNESLDEAKYRAGGLLQPIKSAAMGFKRMFDDMVSKSVAALDLGQQLKFQEETERTIRKVGTASGVVGGSLDNMSVNFRKALPLVSYYGAGIQDLVDITNALSRETGRVQFLSPKDLENMALMQKALGLSDGEMASMADRMQLFGMDATQSTKQFGELAAASRRMGLNSKAVLTEMQKNMRQASTISFRNGTRGMMEMAKHAVNMRMDMSAILGLAQDLWTPEKAIETAAELQVLGGDFAKEFGDPFKLLYAARNEPEKLAESMEKAIGAVYQFNSATGEFESSPMELQRLQIAAEKLGLQFEDLNTSAMQAAKSSVIKGQIAFDASDEEKAFLANVAQIGAGGKATVAIDGEQIELTDVTREQMLKLQDAQIANEGEYWKKSLEKMMTQSESLNNMVKQNEALIASAAVNTYLLEENLLKGAAQKGAGVIRGVAGGAISFMENTIEGLGKSELGTYLEQLKTEAGAKAKEMVGTTPKEIKDAKDKAKEVVDNAEKNAKSVGDSLMKLDFGALDMNLNVTGIEMLTKESKTELFQQFMTFAKEGGMNLFNEAAETYKSE